MHSVDVIIPTRNRHRQTLDAVASVRSQSHEDWRLFIVDDASTDGSPELLREALDQDVRIVFLVRNTNGGPAIARQTGLEAGSGPLVAILDSDDTWRPEKLAVQVDIINRWLEHQPELVGCFSAHTWSHYSAKRVRKLEQQGARETLVRNPLCSSNMSSPLFVRSRLASVGGFVPPHGRNLGTAEGIEFFARVTQAGPLVSHGPVLTDCTTHGQPRVSDVVSSLEGARDLESVLTTHQTWLGSWPEDHARLHARVGSRFMAAGNVQEGRHHLYRSLAISPKRTKIALLREYSPFVAKQVAHQLIGRTRRIR